MSRFKSTYTVFYDHDHWLQVSMDELIRLGIADKISWRSIRRGKTVYLEEGDDMALFLKAKQEQQGFTGHWWDEHDLRHCKPAEPLIHLVTAYGRDFGWAVRSKYPYRYSPA